MGGGDRKDDDANVIKPTFGAAKYWYVDPRAQGIPSPPNQIDIINAVNRLASPNAPPLQYNPMEHVEREHSDNPYDSYPPPGVSF